MIPHSVRLLLWKHATLKSNLFPVTIAITFNRKITYIQTSYKIEKKFWNDQDKEIKAPYPNYKTINIDLRKTISDIELIIANKSIEGKEVTGQMIKDELKGKTRGKNFYTYVNDLKKDKDLAQEKGSRINYQKEINRLEEFSGTYLSMNEIDVTFLRKYEAHERKRGMAQNTLNTTFKWLRTIVTHAAKEGHIKDNPFDSFTIPKYVQSNRIFLEKAERDLWVKNWKEGKVTGSQQHTLTYFLLGVFSGLRNSDWSRALSMVHGDILRLRPTKTHKSGQWVILPIGPTLQSILDALVNTPPPISQRKTQDHLKIIAGVFECKKHITTHVARHSFGALCAENKIPKSVTAELMAVQVETVEIYYHLTGNDIADQANVLRGI